MAMQRLVLTYGTFDLLHYGHIHLLARARALGDLLAVGLSSEGFNALKGKEAAMDYDTRRAFLLQLRCVDEVFPEENWEQKIADVKRLGADTFVMGHDWEGKFDFLKEHCKVVYLPRTDGVSSTELRAIRERIVR
jgi:glycerol-3-phosphate cytidylyltransferase